MKIKVSDQIIKDMQEMSVKLSAPKHISKQNLFIQLYSQKCKSVMV